MISGLKESPLFLKSVIISGYLRTIQNQAAIRALENILPKRKKKKTPESLMTMLMFFFDMPGIVMPDFRNVLERARLKCRRLGTYWTKVSLLSRHPGFFRPVGPTT